MSGRTLGILVAVTALAIVAAFLLAREERHGIPARGQRVFPELEDRVNQVGQVTVRTSGGAVTIARNGDAWVVKEKGSYHAAMDKLRSVVIGVGELTILEPKTKNPEQYAKLGLQDVAAEGSGAVQVILRDLEGATMASLLIGDRRPSRADSTRDELYVRKADDEQTWLAIGRVRPETTPVDWIDRQILDVDTYRVREVRITHPDGHTILLRKANPDDVDFRLLGVPKGAKPRSQYSVNTIADTMAHLTLDDVHRQDDVTLPARGGLTARLETFDGLRVVLRMIEQDGLRYATLAAEFDPDLVQRPDTKAGEEGGSSVQQEQTGETVPGGPAPALHRAEEVQQEVTQLNERFRPWVFVLPRFRAETLATRRETLMKE